MKRWLRPEEVSPAGVASGDERRWIWASGGSPDPSRGSGWQGWPGCLAVLLLQEFVVVVGKAGLGA